MQTSFPSTPTTAPPVKNTISFSFGATILTSEEKTSFELPSSHSTLATLLFISLMTPEILPFLKVIQTCSINHTGASSLSAAPMNEALISLCCTPSSLLVSLFSSVFTVDANGSVGPVSLVEGAHAPSSPWSFPVPQSPLSAPVDSDCSCLVDESDAAPHPSSALFSSEGRSMEPPGRQTSSVPEL